MKKYKNYIDYESYKNCKSYKNEKGGVLIYVLITMLILIILLMGVYNSITNKHIAQLEIAEQIKSTYEEDVNNVDAIYETLTGTTDAETKELIEKINSLSAQVATLKNQIYPVGSIYISTSTTNPSEIFGGTWEAYGEGRTLIGAGTGTDSRGESLEFTLGQTGGEYNHLLTIDEMPNHSHGYFWRTDMVYWNVSHGFGSGANTGAATIDTSATGNDVAHNNLQPYIVTYMWKRIS